MPTYQHRAVAVALLAPLTIVTACAAPKTPPLGADDTVRAAQVLLTDYCLTRQGLTPPRPGQRPTDTEEQRRVTDALFGTGRAELTPQTMRPGARALRLLSAAAAAGAERSAGEVTPIPSLIRLVERAQSARLTNGHHGPSACRTPRNY